jgi:WD40 repeat protein/dimeric dUTPase (all-alpha-NTP-PPase superfamily)
VPVPGCAGETLKLVLKTVQTQVFCPGEIAGVQHQKLSNFMFLSKTGMASVNNSWLIAFALALNLIVCAQAPRIVINPMGHTGKVHSLTFTPDGQRLISVSEDKSIRVWNVANGEMVTKYESQIGDGYEGMFYASALSPNGKYLAVGGYKVDTEQENYIIVIDLEKNIQVGTAVGHTDVITSLSFSGSGLFLASGSEDKTVRIWKMDALPDLRSVATLPVGSSVLSLAFNPRTQELAVAGESRDVLVYPMHGLNEGETAFQPKTLKRHKSMLNKVVYSPEGSYLASCTWENELIVWNKDGSVAREFSKLKNMVNALAFSADGRILVALDGAGNGMSYAIPAGTKFSDFTAHDNAVFSAAFSPSLTGNYLAASAGGSSNEIYIWNPVNGLVVQKIKGKGSPINHLSFGQGLELFFSRELEESQKPKYSSSFNFASFTINRNPARQPSPRTQSKDIYQTSPYSITLAKGKAINIDPYKDGRILDFLVLQDGSVVVAGDFSLKLFDRNGNLNKEFNGHSGAVRSVAISEDGKYLASGSEDQSIILWKMSETGYAPTMRSIFDTQEWSDFFSSLPVDSLTREPTKKAWSEVINFMKNSNIRAVREVETHYKSLGEIVIPFATLFLTEDNEWVCWNPRGYFNCSSAGAQYFGWHVNQGISKLATFYDAEQYFEILFRPKEMAQSLVEGKRVEDILRESGERVFDLGKLHRPSIGLFDISKTLRTHDRPVIYEEGNYFTTSETIPLTVEAYDGGGGIREILIYQNDKLIISDRDIKLPADGSPVTKTYEVEMMNNLNEFRVKVVNVQKIESKASTLNIEHKGDYISNVSLHLLAIGINKYQNSAYDLNYAQSDAKSFSTKLTEQGQGIFKSINKVEVYDSDATRENILTGFRSIISKAKPEDVFVFYYAGHGTLDEEKNEEFYLVPTNVTQLYGDPTQLETKGISATELREYLTQVRAQKQVVFMDACHSGGALKTFNVRAAVDEKAIVKLGRSSGVAVMASSGSQQFATEFEELKHGAFTYALLEALDGKADGGDGVITINEIKSYMEERVPELTRQYSGKSQYPRVHLTGNNYPISVLPKN